MSLKIQTSKNKIKITKSEHPVISAINIAGVFHVFVWLFCFCFFLF